MAKRAPTAFFAYSETVRAEVKAELVAASENGKVSVGDVAKEIGRRWKELSDEVKQEFKDKAAEAHKANTEAAAAAAAAGGGGGGEAGEGEEGQEAAAAAGVKRPGGLPLGTVKKLVMCDKEVKRVSADGLWLVARATECFLELLADKCAAAASGAKRKTIKMDDFESAVRRDKRLVEVGLKQLLPGGGSSAGAAGDKENSGPEAGEGAPEAKKQKREGGGGGGGKAAKKAAEVDAKVPKITSFFSKVPAKPAAAAATAAS